MLSDFVAVYAAPPTKMEWEYDYARPCPPIPEPGVVMVPSEMSSIAMALADCIKAMADLSISGRRIVVKQLAKLVEDDE